MSPVSRGVGRGGRDVVVRGVGRDAGAAAVRGGGGGLFRPRRVRVGDVYTGRTCLFHIPSAFHHRIAQPLEVFTNI